DVLRSDDVADRLRHLATVDVDEEAVCQHLAEGRAAARAEPDEQRALGPAAMLIAPLEIHVGRPAQIRLARQHRFMARSGVEPDVEDVALSIERGPAAGGAGEARRDELF